MRSARACWLLVGDTSPWWHAGSVTPAVSFSINYCMTTEVAGYAAAWKPTSVPAEAAAFARLVVPKAAPAGRDRARNLLWAAGRLAGWAIPLGLEPVPQVLLHPSVIERFAAHAPGLSPPARRTLRTNLRFIARHVVPDLDPADLPLPRERAKAPYSPPRSAGSWHWPPPSPPPGGGCAPPPWCAWALAPG